MTPCRTLILHKSSPFLLRLAPETLQSLSYEHRSLKKPDHPRIAGLTRLTRLELIGVADCSAGGLPLHSPALQELLLIECPGLEAAYLDHNNLNSLQRLHIEQNLEAYRSGVTDSPAKMAEYKRVGSLVESLPHLEQVSGRCALFAFGMAEALKSWNESQCCDLEITKNGRCAPGQQSWKWNRPRESYQQI